MTRMLLCLLFLVLLPSALHAQEVSVRVLPELKLDYVPAPLVAVPAGDDVIVPLSQGRTAAYTGQLLSTDTAIRWVNYLAQARLRLKEDVLLERRTCSATMNYYERRIVLEQEARNGIEADYRDRLLRLEQKNTELQKSILEPGVFKSPVFWFVAGIFTAGTIFGVSAYALHQVQ